MACDTDTDRRLWRLCTVPRGSRPGLQIPRASHGNQNVDWKPAELGYLPGQKLKTSATAASPIAKSHFSGEMDP
jgi:hypothetical protein